MSLMEQATAGGVVVMHEDLSHGFHGANARYELRPGTQSSVHIQLRGWLDEIALRRFETRLDDLGRRGARQLHLDVSGMRHVDYRLIPDWIDALGRFEVRWGPVTVGGLTAYMNDLFCLAGCESRLRGWASAAALEPSREFTT